MNRKGKRKRDFHDENEGQKRKGQEDLIQKFPTVKPSVSVASASISTDTGLNTSNNSARIFHD